MKINRIKLITSLCFICFLSNVSGQEQAVKAPAKEKKANIWNTESRSVYDLLVAQLRNSEADYAGSVNTLIKYAKKQKDEQLLSKSFIALLQTERYADALSLLDFWKTITKADLSKFEVLALVLTNKLDLATEVIKKPLEKITDEQTIDFLIGKYIRMLLTYWYWPEVTNFIERLYELYPDNKKLALVLAKQFRWQGKIDKADKILKQLIFDDPKSITLRQQRSDLFRYAGLIEKANQIWEAALNDYPKEEQIRLSYARFLFEQYQFANALEELRKITSNDSKLSFSVATLKMMSAVQLGDDKTAASAFDWDNLTEKEKNLAHFNYGNELLKKQQFVPSFQQFQKVQEDSELALSAELQKVQIDYHKSVSLGDKSFTKIVKKYQLDKTVAIRQQAKLLQEAKKGQLAYRRLSEYLQKYPENEEVRYSRALLAAELDLMSEAVKDLEIMHAKSPENTDFQNALGYTLLETSDDKKSLKEAIVLIKKSLFIQPTSPAVVDSMGWALYKQGKVKKALPFLRYAYGKYQEPEVLGHLITALFAAGQEEQAKALYQLEVKLPTNKDKIKKHIKSFKKELSE